MKVTQEKLPSSQIGLEIEIPAETSQKTYDKVLNNLVRTANIPGFRKGKIPRQMLLQRLGTKYIKAATLEELIQDSLKSALQQESIESLGNYTPRFSFEELIEQFTPGEPLTISVTVDVPPTVELGDYKNITVKAEETIYDPKQVDDWLAERQTRQATLVPVEDRPAEMGDVAIVDYQSYYALQTEEETPQEIPGVQGSDFRVDLEAGRFIEGMVEGIVGMQPEESKEIPLKFPDDYPNEELAGNNALFSITLKELKAKELPELDDEFAEEASDFDTLVELRESLEEKFAEEAKDETKSSIESAILAELIKISSVDLPDTLVQEEVTKILTQSAMQMEQMGLDIRQIFTNDNVPKLRENARADAVERLQQTLILSEIAKTEGIEPSEAAVTDKIKELTAQFSERDIDLAKLQEMVKKELLTEATLDWLQAQASIELVPKGTLNPVEESEETEEIALPETEETTTVDIAAVPIEETTDT